MPDAKFSERVQNTVKMTLGINKKLFSSNFCYFDNHLDIYMLEIKQRK